MGVMKRRKEMMKGMRNRMRVRRRMWLRRMRVKRRIMWQKLRRMRMKRKMVNNQLCGCVVRWSATFTSNIS
jgi:hypothetical protein